MMLIRVLLDDDIAADLTTKIIIACKYYGLLREGEMMMLQVEDIKINKEKGWIKVDFPYLTKTTPHGFTCFIPSEFIPTFKTFLSKVKGPGQLLRNYNIKAKMFIQPSRNKAPARACELIMDHSERDRKKNKITPHCFRCSGVSTLANAGISIISHRRAGRWNDDTGPKDYGNRSFTSCHHHHISTRQRHSTLSIRTHFQC